MDGEAHTTSQLKRFPSVWVAICLWRCSGRLYLRRQSAHWYRLVVVAWLRAGDEALPGETERVVSAAAGWDGGACRGGGKADGGCNGCCGYDDTWLGAAEEVWKVGGRGRS